MLGHVYIVATPIGNLEDITIRALEILKSCDIILAEDTRKTNILLNHYEINTRTISYHQQSSPSKMLEILKLLIEGKSIALVTDAGTPGISDPGNELIDFLSAQIPELIITPVPGPSSVSAALSVCGFNTNNFMFIGFWPKKKAKKTLDKISKACGTSSVKNCPIIFFESPFRIKKTLDLLIKEFGEDKRIYIGQELTKMHERSFRGSLANAKLQFEAETKELGRVKGELVCILE